MKQGIVGGLLVIGGVILSPFALQIFGWGETLYLMVLSATLSARSYWALWTHGISEGVPLFFLGTLWVILLAWVAIFLVSAVILTMKAVRVFALNQTRNMGIDFNEVTSCLGYSLASLLCSVIFLCFASLADIGVGSWTTKPSFFTESTYKFLFFWGVRGYLYVYPLSMVIAGLFILQDSCRKWGKSVLSR